MKPTRITITIARPDASRFQLWRDNTHWKHVPEAAAARYAFVIGLHVVADAAGHPRHLPQRTPSPAPAPATRTTNNRSTPP